MSRLEELIAELCPDGVEYKTLTEIFHTRNGYTPSKANKSFWENGTIPWFRMEDIRENGRILSSATQYVSKNAVKGDPFPANSIIVATSATIGEHALVTVPSLANQRFTYLMLKEEYASAFNMKFLFYYCFKLDEYCKACLNQGNFASVDMQKFSKFQFPIPPLAVQAEIVRILDSFTEHTTKLTEQLTARKKQYEYYRDKLLTFDVYDASEVQWRTLGEIATFTYGYTAKAQDTGDTRFIRITDIDEDGCLCPSDAKFINLTEESKKYLLKKGDLLLARTGATYGKTLYVPDDHPAVYASFLIKIQLDNNVILNRYYWHFSKSSSYWRQAEKYVSKGGQQQFNSGAVGRIVVPIPPLSVQQRLVDVLDNFDTVCTNLNIGLPAEIEARKKQYEYYRDALLTFAETGAIIRQSAVGSRQSAVGSRQDEYEALIKLCQYVFGTVSVKLSDIATISRGGSFQKKDFVDEGVPCIHYGQIYTKYGIYATETFQSISPEVAKKQKKAAKNDIIMAVTSENVEDVCKCVAWLGEDEIAVSGHTAIIRHNQNAKYLSYYFHTASFFSQKRKLAHGTKVIEVTPDKLKDVIIPLPSLEEQQRIVAILDYFDALCNDLTAGLPAEIAARQRQYEYYRGTLLTFQPIKS